jgi:hypothetical protein
MSGSGGGGGSTVVDAARPPADTGVPDRPPASADMAAGGRDTASAADRSSEAGGGRQALLVTGQNAANMMPYPSDMFLRMRLEAKGLTVVNVNLPDLKVEDFTGKVLAFISGSVDSGMAATKVTDLKVADVAVPLICNEQRIFDDLSLTGPMENTDYGEVMGQTQIQITMMGHALAGGLSGMPTVYGSMRNVRWGLPGAGAVRIATVVGAMNQITIFGYPRGAMMSGNKMAPAKRVGLFVSESTSTVMIVTADGQRVIDAAIDWALAP